MSETEALKEMRQSPQHEAQLLLIEKIMKKGQRKSIIAALLGSAGVIVTSLVSVGAYKTKVDILFEERPQIKKSVEQIALLRGEFLDSTHSLRGAIDNTKVSFHFKK